MKTLFTLFTFHFLWLAIALCGGGSLFTLKAQGVWSPRASFPDTAYFQGISGFSIGNYGYAGLGSSQSLISLDDFWQFNASTNSWTKKAFFPGKARVSPASFVIDGKAYIVTGSVNSAGACVTECWQYDTATGAWTQKANFPGSARVYAVGFAIDSLGYVGTGANELRDFKKDFYAYHPSTNTWTRVADFGGIARDGANGFSVNGKGYVCFGQDSTITNHNDLWEYDPVLNKWSQKSNYPGPGLLGAVGFTICNNIYVGSGDTTANFLSDDHNKFWRYNTASGVWKEVANAPYPPRIQGTAFAISDTGYYGIGADSNGLVHTIFDKFYAPDSCNGYEAIQILFNSIEISIYPNPFKDECFINLPEGNSNKPVFALFNMEGIKQKIDIQGENSFYSLTRDGLKEGVYILSIKYNDQVYYKKLVITD